VADDEGELPCLEVLVWEEGFVICGEGNGLWVSVKGEYSSFARSLGAVMAARRAGEMASL